MPFTGPVLVAIVEDNPVAAQVAEHIVLKQCPNAEVLKSETLCHALPFLDRGPQVWLVDISLLDGDHAGLALIEQIRQRDRVSTVIALTAEGGLRYQCLALGCNAFIEKPLRPEHIQAAVTLFLPSYD